ncbi:MAG: isoprenyl transferase [Bacteroidales bacterium]|nr:isoprenyl transferase [Bacteroidales bacterium]
MNDKHISVETKKIDNTKLPEHIAIIMDGNGRWAKSRGLNRSAGHQEGVTSVHEITDVASRIGLKYLTLYTFSTENWNRPQDEIDALMALMVQSIYNETPLMMKNNVRLRVIGDLSRLPLTARKVLEDCIEKTSVNSGLNMILALSYSSRWEIVDAVKRLVNKVSEGALKNEEITEELFSSYLTTSGIPDPDMLIRTGGEKRISNFLMWQLSYAELYFTDCYWPDFREEQFIDAIIDYQQRERRFGKTSEQLEVNN